MILAGSKTDAIENVKKKLSSKFDIKYLGELKYFLGMTVIQGWGSQRLLKGY